MKYCIPLFLFIIITSNSCREKHRDLEELISLDQTSRPKQFAFLNVIIIDTEKGITIPDRTVLIKDGRIQTIVESTDPISLTNYEIIKSEGQYLMPGLVDMHFHFEHKEDLLLLLANGITTIRNLFGFPKHLEIREQINNKEILGPNIYTSGPIITTHESYPGMEVISGPEEGRNAVNNHLKAGYDLIKLYPRIDSLTFFSILDEALQRNTKVAGHITDDVSIENILSSTIHSIEHLDVYRRKENREQRIDEFVELTNKSNIWNCPTLKVFEFIDTTQHTIKEKLVLPEYKYLSQERRV